MMPQRLAWAIAITDWLFLAYWTAAGLAQAHLLAIPPAWMYAGYDQPRTIAWNWSFLPLDLAFSACGLAALSAARRANAAWRPLALISLILTMTAGGMAISYWVLLREFAPAWFAANAVLVLWPLPFLPALFRQLATPGPAAEQLASPAFLADHPSTASRALALRSPAGGESAMSPADWSPLRRISDVE